jgi:predicted membrane protein
MFTLNLNLMMFTFNPFYIYIFYIHFMGHERKKSQELQLVFHYTTHKSPLFHQHSI